MTNFVEGLRVALADRYDVERELGAGGMATVYLAEDRKHARRVAVKVLRPELAAAVGDDRFLREITTTAGLSHPHILPLFDSGRAEAGGTTFLYYVMPLIEGESLRDRLAREQALPLDDALRIADQVADALHHAHGKGLVHRDIKPENILLADGHAIVADFGIAQAVASSGTEKLTQTGLTLGTPQYMSPEQSSGDVLDARSDLYALACLTYEMLAGAPPFTGPNAMAVMARHALDPVPSLRTVRGTVTEAIAAVISAGLAKSPADRPATLDAWRQALRAAAGGGTGAAGAATSGPSLVATIDKPPPQAPTALIGRDETLAAAATKLRDGTHLLTVTGVGGTGKTRFAMALHDRLRPDFAGGAAFVSLASVTEPAEVMPTIASTLDIAEAHGRTHLDAVATLIGTRQVLLVLDNLEQVLGAAPEIATLVARCPALRVVATSRAPLKVGAEEEFALPPLELPAAGPATPSTLQACPSVALFVQRAAKVRPGFALTPTNAEAVAAICRRLDGLPLALELAAARTRILEPSALLQRLDHALDLLTSGDRDLPMRQRTLRATISWSYSLLEPDEQRLLRRLSVFHEGWTLEAMERVCYAQTDRHRAIDDLGSLVEKGLVRLLDGGDRYRLLETIRAFAAEQLHAGGEVEAARAAHAAWQVEFAADVFRGIEWDRQLDSLRRARAENANTQAAVQWTLQQARTGRAEALEQGLLLCGYMNWPWHIWGLHLTAREPVDSLLAMADANPPTRGRVLTLMTRLVIGSVTSELEMSIRDGERGLAEARTLGDPELIVELSGGLAFTYCITGRFAEAQTVLDEAEAHAAVAGPFHHGLARALRGLARFVEGDLTAARALEAEAIAILDRAGDHEVRGVALSFLAQVEFVGGDPATAQEVYRRSLAAFDTVGDRPEVARVQGELGWCALAMQDTEGAQRWFLKSLLTYDENGSPRGLGRALLGLAATAAAAGENARAVQLGAAARVMAERAGVVVEHPMAPDVVARLDALRATIPGGELDDLVAAGGTLTTADVLAMAGT